MNALAINHTRTIKYSYNIHTGKAIRVSTQRQAGAEPETSADVFEVTDIPPDVTDQQVLNLYNLFIDWWFQPIGIYSYPYSLLEKQQTTGKIQMPSIKKHVEIIMNHKNTSPEKVIDYLSRSRYREKTADRNTLWKYYEANEAPWEIMTAINSITCDILANRVWNTQAN